MSDTNRGRLAYVAESAFGTTPADPDFKIMRLVSSSLAYNKETTQSNELDSSRMLLDVPEVGVSTNGDVSIEWSPVTYDDLIEAALGGTRSTAVSVADSLSIDIVADITITDNNAAGLFTNFEEGQWVLLTGFATEGNNGWFEVEMVTDSDNIVVKDPRGAMANEGTAASPVVGSKISGQTIKNGVEERSFSIEESYLDVFMYRLFKGMRIGSMSMDLSTGSIATGSFNFMGTESVIEETAAGVEPPWLGSGGSRAEIVNASGVAPKVMNSTANVGDIMIDGAISTACFQSLSLNLDNTLRSINCIGSKYPSAINYGRQMISGSIGNLFKNWDLYKKMTDHEDITLSFGLIAPGGEGGIHIYLPRVTLSSDTVNLSGGVDSDVEESIDWSALKHEDGYQIRVDIAG